MTHKRVTGDQRRRLRIGDDWNAIRIIALSQSNPLKAIAEFVENSIDARARRVTIVRGREAGRPYLLVQDDGEGVPRKPDGTPDFDYVATHIGDSLKRRLKADGAEGIQGEFGIGLLSFWTVGEELIMSSTGADQRAYQMRMRKGDPAYSVSPKRTLLAERGTELRIAPLLDGVRHLNGERMQAYLAAELRDRIRSSGVDIRIVDRLSRRQFKVEPRAFTGRLLHSLPGAATAHGEVYVELYLADPSPENCVSLGRSGTRVLENIGELPDFAREPWTSGHLQGLLDAPFLHLTPGTRSGIVHDERYAALVTAIAPLERELTRTLEEQRRAEEEQASRQVLKTLQRAFREALLALPPEEYDWFRIRGHRTQRPAPPTAPGEDDAQPEGVDASRGAEPATGAQDASVDASQREFFHYAGPLFSVTISPAAATMPTGGARTFTATPRDRARRRVEDALDFEWLIAEGGGTLDETSQQSVTLRAPAEPNLVRLVVSARQRDITVSGEALITVTANLPEPIPSPAEAQGLPAYTFHRAAGELWRSQLDAVRNVIVINSGHRDFVFAARHRTLKLRYIARIYAKELILRNFPGTPADQLLERMIELGLYTEEHLK